MAEKWIGLDRIIKARMQGYRPAGWVHIDVSMTTAAQVLLRTTIGAAGQRTTLAEADVGENLPGTPYVLVPPEQSTRMADWGWCVGLCVQVDGDDIARVASAHERIAAAGAERVVSSAVVGHQVHVIDSRAEVAA